MQSVQDRFIKRVAHRCNLPRGRIADMLLPLPTLLTSLDVSLFHTLSLYWQTTTLSHLSSRSKETLFAPGGQSPHTR